jgi:hypothetical protein
MTVSGTPSGSGPGLLVTREEARLRLQANLRRGRDLLSLPVGSTAELMKARLARQEWSTRNQDLLRRLFDDRAIVTDYARLDLGAASTAMDLQGKIDWHRHKVGLGVAVLERILERVESMPVATGGKGR